MKLQTEGGLVVVNSAFRQSVLNHLRGRINSIEDFELLQKFIEGSNFIWTQSPNPKIYQAVDGLLRLNEISDVDYRESLKIFAGHFTQFFYSSYRAYGRPKGMFERYLDFLIQFTNKPPPEWVYANLRLGESSIRFKYEFHQLLLHVQTIEQLQIINRMVALSEENRLVRVNLDIISIMHEMLLKDPSQVQSLSIILKKVEQTSRNFSSSTDVFKEIRENFLEKKIFFTNRYSNSLFIEFGEKYSDLIATVENPYQQLALKAFIEADKRQELKFLTIRLLVKRRLKSIQTQSQADRFVRATVRWNGATDLIIKSQATLPHRSCRKVFSN